MSQLTRNTLYNLAGSGLLLLLGFVVVKFVYSRLGPDVLGLVYLNITLTAVIATGFELGISATTVREVSAHHASDPVYVRSLIRTASAIYWAISLIASVAVFAAAPWLVDNWLNLRQLDPGTATTAVRILAIAAVLALPKLLYASLFRGRQRMAINNGIDVGMAALQQAGTVAVIVAGGDVIRVAIWIAGCAALTQLLYFGFAFRMFGGNALLPWLDRAALRRNASFGAHMMATSILGIVHSQADKVVIAKLLPLAELGYYGVASNVGTRAMILASAVAQASLPALTERAKAGDEQGLLARYRRLQDLVCFGTIPIFTGIIFASLPLFTFMLDRPAAAELLRPMALLAVGFYMNGTMTIPFMVSVATAHPGIASRTNLWALLISLPLTVLLIFKFGLSGAGLAWIVYHLVLYAFMAPRVSRECLGLPTRDFFAHLARPLLAALVTYGPAWAIAWIIGSDPVALALAWVGATAAFAALAYFLAGPDLKGALVAVRMRFNSADGGSSEASK